MMNTKLVYVLTCSEKGTYIEQALMSIWSARYHNPNAHIVLLTDDVTDHLLVGARGELTNYITEKIVIPFDDGNLSMVYRSRWIKTSVRQIITGNFLFIDCDTVVCKSLIEIDSFDCDIGAVWESHLMVDDFCDDLKESAFNANQQIGLDLGSEKEYFSSGVLFVKDKPQTHQLYSLWHQFWLEGLKKGLSIDQPSLAKSNREMGYIIQRIPDFYNCILFTQNTFTDKAHILHIASFRNPSFLFTESVLGFLRDKGLEDWVKEYILHPCDSFLPFDYVVRKSSFKERLVWIDTISSTSKVIHEEFPSLLDVFPMQSSARNFVLWLFHHKCYFWGAVVWMVWKRLQVLRKHGLKENVCRK